MRQTCILILGMHRSGTSALSGVLSILGAHLGSRLMQPKAENPKGFFENDLIYEVNEDLLAQAGSSVHDDFFNESKIANIHNLDKLRHVLLEEFKYSKLFSIKDPRIGYLLPVYVKALKDLGVEVKVVIPIRNPLEVARSLQVRNGFSLEKGLLHWAYHFLVVEKFSRELPRVFTSFEDLIQAPRETIELIDQKLGLNLVAEYDLKKDVVRDFLAPELKHHTVAMNNASENLPIVLRDIVCLIPKLNAMDVGEEFDALRIQLFQYQALFYNPSVTGIFDDYILLKEAMTLKDRELLQIQQALRAKDQSLDQVRNELQSKESELLQSNQALQEKAQVLEYTRQGLHVKDHLLEKALQEALSSSRELDRLRQEFQSKERELLLANQRLQEKAQALEYTKQGLHVKDHLLEEALQEALTISLEVERLRQEVQSISQALECTKRELHANDQELRYAKQCLNKKEQALQLQANMQAQAFSHFHNEISELNELKQEILNIYKSRSWKVTRFFRKIKRIF